MESTLLGRGVDTVDTRTAMERWLGLGWVALFCWTMTALPTGNVGPINLKTLVTLGGICLIVAQLIRHRSWSDLSGLRWPTIWTCGFLTVGVIAAVAHQVPWLMMSTQVKMLAAPLVVCGMGMAFVRLGIVSDRGLLVMLVMAHLTYVLGKVGISTALATGMMSWDHAQALMTRMWPSSQFGIGPIPGGFARMVLPNDIVSTIAIVVLLSWDRLRLVPRLPYLMAVVAVMLVMLGAYQNVTRAIWVMTLAGVVIGCWMAWDRRRMITLAVMGFALATVIIAVPGCWTLIIQRFTGTTIAGEATRVQETQALWTAFTQSWVWGHGWGHGLVDCVRNGELPFDYEVQWVAWLMQSGVLGMSCALALVWMMGRRLLDLGWRGAPLVALFAMWFFSGFTNPLLHCSAAGVYVLMLMLMADLMDREVRESQ